MVLRLDGSAAAVLKTMDILVVCKNQFALKTVPPNVLKKINASLAPASYPSGIMTAIQR